MKSVTSGNWKRWFEHRGSKGGLKLPEIGVVPTIRFDDHPAAIFGLGFTMHDFAEAIQVESRDVVMAFPFKVDVQPVCWGIVVYTHDERCVPGAFHTDSLNYFQQSFSE